MHSERPARLGRVLSSTFVGILVCALFIAAFPENALAVPASDPHQADGMARGLTQRIATAPIADLDDRRQLRGSRRKRLRTRASITGGDQMALVQSTWAGAAAARSPLAVMRSATRQATPARAPDAASSKSAPDGYLVSWRKHANGSVAAVIGHYDGGLTARPWPQTAPFVTGLNSLAEAQALADTFAHADCAGNCCGPWRMA